MPRARRGRRTRYIYTARPLCDNLAVSLTLPRVSRPACFRVRSGAVLCAWTLYKIIVLLLTCALRALPFFACAADPKHTRSLPFLLSTGRAQLPRHPLAAQRDRLTAKQPPSGPWCGQHPHSLLSEPSPDIVAAVSHSAVLTSPVCLHTRPPLVSTRPRHVMRTSSPHGIQCLSSTTLLTPRHEWLEARSGVVTGMPDACTRPSLASASLRATSAPSRPLFRPLCPSVCNRVCTSLTLFRWV